MKVFKSLQEVWDWKEKGYQRTKNLTMEERVKGIKKNADEFCKKYGLKLKTLQPLHK